MYATLCRLIAGCAVLAATASLALMWTVTDFSHSMQDLAVLFYALLVISPYLAALTWTRRFLRTAESAGLGLLTIVMIALIGLYAYYQGFVLSPNDHSGFLFLFVPCLQWLVVLAVARILRALESDSG